MRLYSTLDCARALGLQEHKITYAHRSGRLPEPKHIVAGKRIYTDDDVQKVANHFGIAWKSKEKEREEY